MKAFVTSVGEETTALCIWALERNGFDVQLYESKSSLWHKLNAIYDSVDEDFLRVDADVIVNQNCTENNIRLTEEIAYLKDAWWIQFRTFSWFQQDLTHGGVQYYKKQTIPYLREAAAKFKDIDRPETQLSRIYQFYNPRRFETNDMVMGIHGYGIKDMKPVIRTKANRGQSEGYDFELARRLNELS